MNNIRLSFNIFKSLRILFVVAAAVAVMLLSGAFSSSYAASGNYTDTHENVVSWDFNDADGTLNISVAGTIDEIKGSGIIDFGYGKAPWDEYRDQIQEVRIGAGLSWLAGETFRGYTNLKKFTVEGSNLDMTDLFLADCTSLEYVSLPEDGTFYIQTDYDEDSDDYVTSSMYDGYAEVYGPFSGCDIYRLEFDVPVNSTIAGCIDRFGLKIKGQKWNIEGKFTFAGAADHNEGFYVDDWYGDFLITSVEYIGSACEPVPEIYFHGGQLRYGTDFTTSYSNNVNIGDQAKCTVEGTGDYRGSAVYYFEIHPKGTRITKVKSPAKKKLQVTWLKQTKKMKKYRVNGYCVEAATDKAFTKNVKTVYVKGYNKSSCTMKSLKSGKKYYIRIRTYAVNENVDTLDYCYSEWSPTKSVKVK